MPSLAGAEWLNSAALGPAELLGRPVVVNFWTLTCINWLRQEPYVRAWAQAYRDDGLIVIGVHTPEFAFEHSPDLVRQAVADRGIDYPVVLDNDYKVWNAFDNHYWPALYFVDADGIIRDFHFGEGRYADSERTIQRLLTISRTPVAVKGDGVEAAADWDSLRTLETYVGYGRGERFASPGEDGQGYRFPPYLHLNDWALDGQWTRGREFAEVNEPGGSIAFRFQARDVNLVMAAAGSEPVPFHVFLDGEAPGAAHGLDIDEQGNGVLRTGRLYQLVRQPDKVRERTVEISFDGTGARAYSFTFG